MRIFALLLAILSVGVALVRAAGDQPLVLEVKAPQAATVTSTAELKKQPEILANGVPVRLGLESAKVPAGSGVLAYCLWTPENGRSYVSTGPRPAGLLGPLSVQIRKEGAMAAQMRTSTRFDLAGEQVSVAGLMVQGPGRYAVEFLAPDGTIVATAELEAVENKMPPWYAFTLVAADKVQSPELDARVKLGQYAVVPRWPAAASAKVEEGLRTFVPAAVDADFKAAWVDGALVVTRKGPLMMASNVNLLVRWWVNGKPVTVAEAGPRIVASSSILKGATLEGEAKVRLTIEGAMETIGEKPGDKVEAQVLYTTFGWDYATPAAIARVAMPGVEAPGKVLQLSNKAEMVVK